MKGEISKKKPVYLKIEYFSFPKIKFTSITDTLYCTISYPHFWQPKIRIYAYIIFEISS